MPKIANLDVPDHLWQELVINRAIIFAHDAAKMIATEFPEGAFGIEIKDKKDPVSEALHKELRTLEKRLNEVAKSQGKRSSSMVKVAADRFGLSIGFKAMFDIDHLKAVAEEQLSAMKKRQSLNSNSSP